MRSPPYLLCFATTRHPHNVGLTSQAAFSVRRLRCRENDSVDDATHSINLRGVRHTVCRAALGLRTCTIPVHTTTQSRLSKSAVNGLWKERPGFATNAFTRKFGPELPSPCWQPTVVARYACWPAVVGDECRRQLTEAGTAQARKHETVTCLLPRSSGRMLCHRYALRTRGRPLVQADEPPTRGCPQGSGHAGFGRCLEATPGTWGVP